MHSRLFPLIATSVAVVVSAGCCTMTRRDAAYVAPVAPIAVAAPCDRCPAGPVPVVPAVPAPQPGAVAVPAQGAVAVPPTGVIQPVNPVAGNIVQGNYYNPPAAEWKQPTQEPSVRLSPPELSVPTAPQTAEPPMASPPATVAEKSEATATPIDIPQFKIARANVAIGLQPFPDGVVWLKSHGYRTVLHLKAPGADDTAARRQFEKNGLRYLALDVDPRSLSKDIVDYFNRYVQDSANQPLFVYDSDGALNGGLWYLHYRLVEGWTNEKALAETATLGFRQDQDDSHRSMWVAVQKLLAANGR